MIANGFPLLYSLQIFAPWSLSLFLISLWYTVRGGDDLHKEEKGNIMLLVVLTEKGGDIMMVVVPTLVLTSSAE